MCKFSIKIIIFLFILLFSYTYILPAEAQELSPPEEGQTEESESSDELDNESEGSEQSEDEELSFEEETPATHLLTFTLNATFQFIDLDLAPGEDIQTKGPYMENQYSLHFEAPIPLDRKTATTSLQAEYEIDHWGDFSTEYFDCRLEIAIENLPVTVTTHLKDQVDEETDEVLSQELTLKIDFGAEIKEEWSGFCLALTGDQLNSQGDSENYLYQAIQSADPSLSQIVLENFFPNDSSEVLLTIPLTIFPDYELNNNITMEGEVKIELDPL